MKLRASLERFWRKQWREALAGNLLFAPGVGRRDRGQLSPSQFNPLELNPLRDLLAKEVDFEAVRTRSPVRLLISANPRSGRSGPGVPHQGDQPGGGARVGVPAPVHHAVEIQGEPHWDGGYAANPPILPLVSASRTSTYCVVHLIPTDHVGLPTKSPEIDKRVGQITFNSPLQKDLEAIAIMKNLSARRASHSSLGRKLQSCNSIRIRPKTMWRGSAK